MNASARPSPPASIPLPSWHGSDSANYDLFAKAGQTHVRSAVRRRGLPDERDLARVRPEETDIRELVGSVSSLMAVARDDDGRIYAVHGGQRVRRGKKRRRFRRTGEVVCVKYDGGRKRGLPRHTGAHIGCRPATNMTSEIVPSAQAADLGDRGETDSGEPEELHLQHPSRPPRVAPLDQDRTLVGASGNHSGVRAAVPQNGQADLPLHSQKV